jgi:hypothetical protein
VEYVPTLPSSVRVDTRETVDKSADCKPIVDVSCDSVWLCCCWLAIYLFTAGQDPLACEIIDVGHLDVLVLSETWHHSSDDISLHQDTPHGYACVDVVRASDTEHGGLVVIYHSCYQFSQPSIPPGCVK